MTAPAMAAPDKGASLVTPDARTRRRNASERRFRLLGLSAVGVGLLALVVLLTSVLGNGLSAFRQTWITRAGQAGQPQPG